MDEIDVFEANSLTSKVRCFAFGMSRESVVILSVTVPADPLRPSQVFGI